VYGGEHALLGFGNSYFSNNAGEYGGAVACYGCQLAITSTTFLHNQGATAGGALYLEGGNASISLSETTLLANRAGGGGGGALVLGASVDRRLSSIGEARSGISSVRVLGDVRVSLCVARGCLRLNVWGGVGGC
jgi:hypothetical protein